MFLRQSTIQTIRFGPFLDAGDGVTEETALTITQALRRLSKDGGNFAQSGETGNSTHDEDGWYFDDLTAADTNTVGELILAVATPATHLPVWMRWWVIEEAVYDAMYGAGAAGPLQATTAGRTLDIAATGEAALDFGSTIGTLDAAQFGADFLTAAKIANNAFVAANFAASSLDGKGDWNTDKTGYALSAAGVDAIWDELMAGHVTVDSAGLVLNDWQDGGRLDLLLDLIPTTAMRGTDGVDTATMRGTNSALLAASAPTNFGDLAITLTTGLVSVGTIGANVIDAASIASNAITAVKIATAAITSAKFAAGAINNAAIAADAIDNTKLAANAIGASEFADDARDKIVDQVWEELQADHVTAATFGLLATEIADILIDTAVIGAAGAGLTAIPWNASWDAEVQSEVDDALDTVISEVAQGVPAATPTMRSGLMLMYMALRNKLDVTTSGADFLEIHNDAGTIITKKALTDAGGDYSEAKMITGL